MHARHIEPLGQDINVAQHARLAIAVSFDDILTRDFSKRPIKVRSGDASIRELRRDVAAMVDVNAKHNRLHPLAVLVVVLHCVACDRRFVHHRGELFLRVISSPRLDARHIWHGGGKYPAWREKTMLGQPAWRLAANHDFGDVLQAAPIKSLRCCCYQKPVRVGPVIRHLAPTVRHGSVRLVDD